MSETSNRNRALAPVDHSPWRSRWRIPRYVGCLALLGALGFEYAMCHERQLDCATVAHTGAGTVIVDVCGREYHRTDDPATGVLLADGHRLVGNLGDAKQLAGKLVNTPVAGDALRVLAQVARVEHHYDEALALFAQAQARHRQDGDHDGLARDAQAIAGVYSARHDQPAALRALDECIKLTNDLSLLAYCHLSAAKATRRSGAFDSARKEFDLAQPELLGRKRERDLASMYFERGSLEQDARRIPRAPRRLQLERLSFESAIVHARKAELPSV
jgi:tetratricopeptide (TPR) repeat protein